jgi:hypothetical protein
MFMKDTLVMLHLFLLDILSVFIKLLESLIATILHVFAYLLNCFSFLFIFLS